MPSKKRKKSTSAAPTPRGVTPLRRSETPPAGRRFEGGQSGTGMFPKGKKS